MSSDLSFAVPTYTTGPKDEIESHRNYEEHQYLNLIQEILQRGEHRPDRTGTGTLSVFAPPQLRFSLRNGAFPLLTTKRVFLKAVILELLWFISGKTNSKLLSSQGVKIWDGNGSRKFLDKLGFTERDEGDLGPVYGFQWRHFGAEYVDCTTNYGGKGVDQLKDVMWKIMNNPYDRRIILTAWNPADLGKMVLPPCHMFAQFYVSYPDKRRVRAKDRRGGDHNLEVLLDELGDVDKSPPQSKGELHCVLYQRSCDMGLGVPFNIASYALLTKMIAHVCDLEAGEFVHTMGDAHVYLDHVQALNVQIQREPKKWPKMTILRSREEIGGIDGFKYEDFKLEDYECWPAVKMNMSV